MTLEEEDTVTWSRFVKTAWTAFVIIVVIVGLGMWGCPQYTVYSRTLLGEAELARAEQNRKITVEEANAKKEASNSLAEAEVIRARGVSEAISEIAGKLGGHEGYLRYIFIQMLLETGGEGRETIYIPTEATLPILEARRLAPKPTTSE